MKKRELSSLIWVWTTELKCDDFMHNNSKFSFFPLAAKPFISVIHSNLERIKDLDTVFRQLVLRVVVLATFL